MQHTMKRIGTLAGSAVALSTLVAPAFGQATTNNQRWQVRYTVDRYLDPSEGGGLTSTQVFEISWNGATWSAPTQISSSGNLASKQNIGKVNITISGRVGIVGQNNADPSDPASPAAVRNNGLNRLGGTGSNTAGYRIEASDPSPDLSNPNHRLDQGGTGETRSGNPILDANGNPIAGTYAPFRVGFSPTGLPFAQGSNTDSNNGGFTNGATGVVRAFNLTGSRNSNVGGDGTAGAIGQATLDGSNNINGGSFADFYRLTYTPNKNFTNVDSQVYRPITISVIGGGQTPRYMTVANTSTSYSSANGPAWANHSFSFFVPTPGSAALVGLAGLAGLRRRRA